MARFSRLDVLNRTLEQALVPVFHHDEAEVTCRVAAACAAADLTLFEFTNRGDHAIAVFEALAKHCRQHLSNVIVGAGSIGDESTAALFAAQGANFIVGPSFDEGVARLCNRHKIAYFPGCQTAREIAQAEEMGVEIVKLFPCEAAGGPPFVKAILGPSPWTRLMPTGLSGVSRESLALWFKAGACAVGIGSEMIKKEFVAARDYDAITRRAAEIRQWVRQARAG
jgi:2-dehydro-3-deoxyphosphogluconate aldolase/(4S)-4-hydroxy-2-oxoglutarate aldolase